jgi:putative sigma-54 modulation protein
MQLQIKGKNLEVSDTIRSYAERKLAKLDKQLHDTTRVEIELAVEKNPSVSANQVAEATVWLKGHTLRAREATRDMKASIDELAEKLLRQVHDERDKKVRKRKVDKHALDADGVPPPVTPPDY